MRLVFNDQTFSFELLRTLSYAPYGGADIGECLLTANRIEEGNFESWYKEWHATAERVHSLAESALAAGQRVSAREAYLRASNYYRTAEFFLHGNVHDSRILSTWENSRITFWQAAQLMDTPVEQVNIPYEGTNLTGYLYKVDDSNKPRPTLIIHGGYDSTGEELYFGGAAAAIQRGYNCLTFEGPGQGSAIRLQQLPFRPDWEKVVTPVVDYACTRSEIDPQRIALMGISFGGYLAPRAAAYEQRLAACIANDGLYTFRFSEMGRPFMIANGKKDVQPTDYEEVIRKIMNQHSGVRWAIENGMFTFQASSLMELVHKTEPYSLEGVAELITCPTLICEAEADLFFAGQPQRLYDALTCSKTFMKFTAEDGAEEHCHFGALLLFNHRLFEWLDRTLEINSYNSQPAYRAQ
ncbi:Alpha/beta hydrolase family protein [Paenibacillus sp. 1_12]|uniref:alpha/beta hydrolase family protein n=1 Tax=Paenibacillus sp. 1_12 TaxID=1566278 RepID=UPI0008DF5364|nr:alpha/beta fold hydrolase [Paenibacillus sp. 1_12]SFL16563.1 Alpha/beta hydrolase family protein [Paenibacillus sp. 1_12]